jgi:hypothetical protein
VTSPEEARDLAMSLPEAGEQDHHGLPSYRIGGKIFATVPDDQHLRIMLGQDEIRAAVARNPSCCQELYWGARLSCVEVDLATAPVRLVSELLTEAWVRKASKKAASAFLDRQ